MTTNELPITLDIIAKRGEIPKLISRLSYKNQEKAIQYMRIWGEKRMPITILHEQLSKELKKEDDHEINHRRKT